MKATRHRNNIIALETSKGRIKEVELIKVEVKSIFEVRFREEKLRRHVLDGII